MNIHSEYSPLGPSAEAAYAQVMDNVTFRSLQRSVADLTGTFAKKTVSGKEYWYFQYRDVDQCVKQIYLGPRSERLEHLMAEKANASDARLQSLSRHAKAAIALGNMGIVRSQYRVIKRLEEYGFFNAGGVLIGTHAFMSYGNMLGVHWGEAAQTQDLDFAYAGGRVALAIGADVKIDVYDAITSLEMGFLPASKLGGTMGGSYVAPHQPDFRIDFITTTGRDDGEVVQFPELNISMIPLKFIEYSLVDIQQAAVLSEEGAVLVNLPSPARYALHKLIVAGERAGSYQTKVNKDLSQAASLLRYLAKHQSEIVMEAWEDLQSRGKGWRSRFEKGVDMLRRALPEIDPALIWLARAKTASNTKALQTRSPTQDMVSLGKQLKALQENVSESKDVTVNNVKRSDDDGPAGP